MLSVSSVLKQPLVFLSVVMSPKLVLVKPNLTPTALRRMSARISELGIQYEKGTCRVTVCEYMYRHAGRGERRKEMQRGILERWKGKK